MYTAGYDKMALQAGSGPKYDASPEGPSMLISLLASYFSQVIFNPISGLGCSNIKVVQRDTYLSSLAILFPLPCLFHGR